MGGRRRLACRLLAAVGPHVRLAELVSGLSLGIDLGFGQPMEHVLRQCLIALRLADGLGLDEQQRAVVYYTALLLNVGCHSDAHEQAKWFGDDIASKAIKYDHDLKSLRMAADALGAAYERWDGRGWPWSPPWLALSFDTFGMWSPPSVVAATR